MNTFHVFGLMVLVHVTVMTTVTILFVWLGRHRSAVQHTVGVIGLMLTLCSPILVLALPQPNWLSTSRMSKTKPDLPMPNSKNDLSTFSGSDPLSPSNQEPAAITKTASSRTDTSRTPNPVSAFPAIYRTTILAVLMNSLFTVWVLGSAWAVFRLWKSRRTLRYLSHSWKTISSVQLERIERDVCLASTLDKLPPIRVAELAPIPLVMGILKPVVVLPKEFAESANDSRLRDVLIHECAHIVRLDPWVHALQQVAAILFWIHPGIYWLNRQISRVREELCDNFVIRQGDPTDYAQTLLVLSEFCGRQRYSLSTLGLFTSRWTLEERIRDLLDFKRMTRTQTRWETKLGLGILLNVVSLLVGGVGVIQVNSAEQQAPKSSQPRQIALADEAKLANKDPIPQGPVLTDRLPFTIEGCIRDQQNQVVAGATVNLQIERLDEFGYPTGELAPGPWTATTDADGRYAVSTNSPSLGRNDVLGIKVRAEGFVDYQQFRGVGGHLWDTVKIYKARRIQGKIVDPDGHPIEKAIFRFQANTPNLILLWDSGVIPLPMDLDGTFSMSIPEDGKAAFAIYPLGFAPRIVEIPATEKDLGQVRVERGTVLKGRVVDKQGQAVVGTVVSVQSQMVILYAFAIHIGLAVKTDDNGEFLFPPLHGRYVLSVTERAPDFSRQLVEIGVNPPPIGPRIIDLSGTVKTKELLLRETRSIEIRGHVRWNDGSPVKNVEMKAYMFPPNWPHGIDLTLARTDDNGKYSLKVPTQLERVFVIYSRGHIRAPDGTLQKLFAKRTSPTSRISKNSTEIEFDVLSDNVDDADWVVGP